MLETAVVEAPNPEEIEDTNEAWIEALPARVYHVPEYGDVPITLDKLERFITNFKQNVRGQEIATDYEHGLDTAKGRQASGWYRDFDIRPSSDDPNQMSLYAKVEFTEDAKKDIRDKKYKYWSLEWDDEYETDNRQIVPDVVIGGGLTNRPVAKRTMPINFSENMWENLSDEDKKYAARILKERKLLSELNPESKKMLSELMSKGFQVRLSEAAMEHSDPGIGAPIYEADNQPDPGTGQMVPRVTGDPSRNDPAIAGGWRRDPLPVVNPKEEGDPIAEQESREHTNVQMSEITDLRSAASALESFVTAERGETPPDTADAQEAQALLERVRALLAKEAKEPENTRKAASELINEIKTFAQSKGGKSMKFNEAQLSKLKELGFEVSTDDDADADEFVSGIEKQFSELKQFKDTVGASSQEKQFAEMFPQQHKEHMELLATNRANAAKTFAESNSRIHKVDGVEGDTVKLSPTRNGLSASALESVAEAHKKFAEGTGTLEDFETTIKTITGGGVVEFGEIGSSAEPEPIAIDSTSAVGIANARKIFAEKVSEVQAKHAKENNGEQLEIMAATAKASTLYPELAEAYRATAA